MSNVHSTITYVSSGVAVVLGLLNDYAAAIGVLIAILTFLINVYYKRKQLELLKQSHNIDLKDLE